jgi:N utilization substance protein A
MSVASAFGNVELLQIADAVGREKGIDKDVIIEAMEQAVQVAGRKKYGYEHNIRAEIDRKTGEMKLYRVITVVEEVEDEVTEITLAEVHKNDKELSIGDEIKEPLPPIDFGRIAAQTAKQVITQKVRDAEREKQYEEFKDKVGEIASGVVKRVEYGNVIIDFGRTEAMIRRESLIPRETFRANDRIRAYIERVSDDKIGPQVFLSRISPDFTSKLFAQEVPEIYDGIIEIKAVARDPGSRAKIAVMSHDAGVNPVLSCVGVRGSRVQAVVGELQGEKIDIVEWSPDPATFVINALSSAEVSKVVIDEDNGRIEVVVDEEQLSLAIGRRGQNVRLASMLTGWSIDIMTEEEEANRRAEEFNRLSGMFTEALNVEEVIAHLLVSEGFSSLEEITYVPVEDLASIEGFDEEVATELRDRAQQAIDVKHEQDQAKLKELGVTDDLANFGLKDNVLLKLAEQGVKTQDDFAELATDEFFEMITDSGYSREEMDELIMKARAHWFEGEEAEKAAQ